MINSTDIVFIVIFALEAAAIITGNVFTIIVFWTQRTHLKRAYFLLINLAVADLLVGVTETVSLGTEKVPKMKAVRMEDVNKIKDPLLAFQLLGSSTSVIFLALISLERAHAVLRPLRHRVINTRVYICAIVIAWTAGLCIAGTYLLATYHTEVDKVYVFVAIHLFLIMCVLFICASYLTVRTRLHFTIPEIDIHNQRSTEQNLQLSKTFFIVAAVSLVFWLPAVVVYIIGQFCRKECFLPTVVAYVNCLHLANSMVNPLVYCFRMPIFKNALKKCCRRRVENIESRAAPLNVRNRAVEFTTHL
ncbi:sphingosine 1-phosphate receptor 1-like [Oculina patagonica]